MRHKDRLLFFVPILGVLFLETNVDSFARLAEGEPQANLELETRAKTIETKLIAPCCGRQTVADHDSAAADQIKRDIRDMLARGATQNEILDAYVGRYGEHILAEPRARGFGLVAWLLPPIFFLSGAVIVVRLLRRWTQLVPAAVSTCASPTLHPP